MTEMKLQDKYYEYILNGTKRIEIKLNDEKRQGIKIGDKIKFINESDASKYFIATVCNLTYYNTIDEMFNDYNIEILADKSMTKEELRQVLMEFYTIEKQNKYGMVAILIKLD